MRFMLLMQFSRTTGIPEISTWSKEEVRSHIAFMKDVNTGLAEAGELVDGQGLAEPDSARVVRARTAGAPAVDSGPFPDSKEFLTGYWIVDCGSEGRAVEIAAHISTAPGPGGEPLNMPIEVRRVLTRPPDER